MQESIICTRCGVVVAHPKANYCFCCGSNKEHFTVEPDIPSKFKPSEDEVLQALEKTLATYSNRRPNML